MAEARKPETIQEYRRIAHAFLAGSRYPAGTKVYAVMSILAPLYRIQGVYAGMDEAERVRLASVPPNLGWTKEEVDARQLIEAVVPDTTTMNRVVVIEKDEWTGETFAVADSVVYPGDRSADEIQGMELVVNYRSGPVRYAINREAVAIFITRGAAEMFLLPHSLDTFGHDYEQALRGWMDRMIAERGGGTSESV